MIEPILFFAVTPHGKDDELKIADALSRLSDEDKALQKRMEPNSGKLLVLGTGELHLDAIRRRMRRDFGVKAEFGPYEVFCRETIRSKARQVATYSREIGGRRQFAQCIVEFEPLAKPERNEFVDALKKREMPPRHAAAVEAGVREALDNGLFPGYPIVGVRASLVGGESRDPESDEAAFKIAGAMAVRSAYSKANPIILEPIMKCEVAVSDSLADAVVSDLNDRRAKMLEITGAGPKRVKCTVPLSTMLGYADHLLAITDHSATFAMEPSHFEEKS